MSGAGATPRVVRLLDRPRDQRDAARDRGPADELVPETAPAGSVDARLVPGSPPAPIAGATARELMDQALHARKAGKVCPPAVWRWFGDGLQGYADEGHAGTLEHHLGLKVEQYRGRSAVRRRVVERRWRALGAAYSAQIDCDDKPPFRRCTILLADLEAFGKSFWPDWRRDGPPKDRSSSRLRLALFDVFMAYDGVPPRNANSIGRALAQAGIIVPVLDSHE